MTSIVGGSAEGAARGTGKLKAVAEMEEDEADEAEGEARGRGLARAALSLAEIGESQVCFGLPGRA